MLRIPKSFIAGASAVLVMCVLGLGTSSALAQSAPSTAHGKATALPAKKPDGTWESLKPSQQQILAPLESDWDYMPPDSRKKWMQVVNIYPKMSEQDQQRLQSRMASWSKLSQKERRIARENYLSSLKFPAEKKAEAWTAYQKLSDEQKKKLADAQTKKKPSVISAPTLQQHTVNLSGTPPPPTPNPRSIPTAEAPPAPEGGTSNN
jgi:hypothetical protein